MSKAVFETDRVVVAESKMFRLAVYLDAGAVSVVGEIEEQDEFGTWHCAVRYEMPDEALRHTPQWAHLCRWHLASVDGTPYQYEALARHWGAVLAGYENHGGALDPEAAFKRVTVFGAVDGDALPDLAPYATRAGVEIAVDRWCYARLPALREAFRVDFEAVGLLTWGAS
jgi:hypothetical protein